MARVHLLNVAPGDCTIIEHNSGRLSMIDICGGNLEVRQQVAEAMMIKSANAAATAGNYRMCERPSNPINYMKTFGLGRVWRFILSHPDMDHMDGLHNLSEQIGINNYWDTGARRKAPKFEKFYRYNPDDWKKYEQLITGKGGASIAQRLAGHRFGLANQAEGGGAGGDGLSISAPGKELLSDPDENDDVNEASYIVTYYSHAGHFVFPGDAHNVGWEYAMQHQGDDLANCAFLLAPHHGRDSDRSWDFLDFMKPKMTWIGCSPSEYIGYEQWDRRKLPKLMSNQTGNTVLEIGSGYYDIYVENEKFARDSRAEVRAKNKEGYTFLQRITTG